MSQKATDKFKKYSKKKLVENKKKTRQENANKYQGGKLKTSRQSSDQAYIRGDVRQLASNNMYAHNNGMSTLDEQSIRKQREVKRDYKTTPRAKQAIIRSATPEGTKFTDHLNTFKADGYETSRMNTRSGQPIRNALRLGAGTAKDLIVDPVVDVMKFVDYGVGAGTGFASGLFEQSANAFTSIAEGKNNLNKGLAINNAKQSIDESNKTGWGQGFGHYLKQAMNRSNDNYGVTLTDEKQQKQDNLLELTGLGMDIMAGGLDAKTFKNALSGVVSDTSKANRMVAKGMMEEAGVIGNQNVAILPPEIQKFVEKSKVRKGAKNNFSDEVFYAGEKMDSNHLTSRLDNSYNNAVTKSDKPKIETGKPSLDNMLSSLKPRKSGVAKEGGMFPYNAKPFELNSGSEKYNSLLAKQGDDLLDALDELPLSEQDKAYDYIRAKDPELYETLVYESNIVEETAKPIKLKKGETYDGIDPKIIERNNKIDAMKVAKNNIERNATYKNKLNKDSQIISNKKKMYDGYVDYLKKHDPNKSYELQNGLNKGALYKNRVKDMFNPSNMLGEHSGRTVNVSKYAKEILPKIKNKEVKDYRKVIDELNNIMFDGKNVIRQNLTEKGTRDIEEFVSFLSKYDGSKESLNKMSKEMNMFEKGLTDFYYNDKMEKLYKDFPIKIDVKDMPSELSKYQGKKGITEARNFKKAVNKLYKDGNAPSSVKREVDRLSEIEGNRGDTWKKYREMSEDDWYASFGDSKQTKGYDEVRDEYASNDLHNSRFDYNRDVMKLDTGEKVRTGGESAILDNGRQVTRSNNNLDENIGYKELYDARKKLGLKFVNSKTPITIPKNKQTYKNILANKQSKGALQNLRKLIDEELKYSFGTKTVDTTPIHNIRNLINENIKHLDKLGIDRNVYFNKIKDYKLKAMEDIKPNKTPSTSYNELDKLGIKLNNKNIVGDQVGGLDEDALQAKYLFTQGAKSFDELFEFVPKSQSGDNIGNEIGSMLRPNNAPKRKKGNAPNGAKYGKKTPLDDIASDDDFNPFAKFESYDDVDMETGEIIPKERRAKTKEEIAEIDKMIARGNARGGKTKTGVDKPLPKISELVRMGHSQDEAIKLYEGMRDGTIEVPEIKYKKDTKIRDGVEYTDTIRDVDSMKSSYGKPKEDDLTVLERMFGSTKDINYGNKTPGYKPLKQDKLKVNKVDDVDMSNTNKWGEVVEETPLDKASNTITRADKGSTKFKDKTDKELMSYVRNGTKKQQKNAKKILKSRGVDVPVEKKSNRTRLEQIAKGNEVIESNKRQLKYNEIERANEEAMKKAGWKRSEPTEDINHNTNPFTGEILKDGEKVNPFGDLKPNPNALDKIPDDKPSVWDTRPTDKSIIQRTPKEQAILDRKMRVNKAKRTGDKSELVTGDVDYGVNPFTGEILEEGDKVNPMTGDTIKKGDPRAKTTDNASDAMRASDDVPKEVIDELAVETEELAKEGVDASKQPPKTKPKGMSDNLYTKWLNAWKKGVTIYNPGWHVQNFFQNKGQNYLAIGNKAFAPQTDAKRILKTIQGEKSKPVNVNGLGNDELAKLAKDLGVVNSFGDDIKMSNKLDNSRFMQKLGESEKTARLHHWVKQMEDGMSPEQALKSVNDYLFDYSDVGKVDKVMKNIDPFWMFHKNNAKMLTKSAVKHPFRMTAIERGINGLGKDISDEERQSENSSYGKKQWRGANYHDNVSNADFNYMYDPNMFPDMEEGIPSSEEDVMNKLNPAISVLDRFIKNEGSFGKKVVPVGEEAGWNEITRLGQVKEFAKDLNPILPGLINTVDKVNGREQKYEDDKQGRTITDKQVLNDWLNYIFGNKANWYKNLD